MSDHHLSTLHAWLLACSLIQLFLCGVAAITGAIELQPTWAGALYLLVAVIALTPVAKILTTR